MSYISIKDKSLFAEQSIDSLNQKNAGSHISMSSENVSALVKALIEQNKQKQSVPMFVPSSLPQEKTTEKEWSKGSFYLPQEELKK